MRENKVVAKRKYYITLNNITRIAFFETHTVWYLFLICCSSTVIVVACISLIPNSYKSVDITFHMHFKMYAI